MPRERNSLKIDFALTVNDDVKDFLVRMLRHKLADMQFEKEYFETELSIAADQKKVNLSNGRKYSDLYKEKMKRLELETENFQNSIAVVEKIVFPSKKFVPLKTNVKEEEQEQE